MKITDTLWKEFEYDEKHINKLIKDFNLSPVQATILANRNLDVEDLKYLFSASEADLHNPMLLPDSEKATSILKKAIKEQQEIVIYGDYDVDGVTSTAVAYILLKDLLPVNYYVNNRFTQGYGLVQSGIDEILEKHPNTKVIVTVDNGISAFDSIRYAKEKGLVVLVTDHHEPMDLLPEADAIVNPKRKDNTYPFTSLCGAGVIWKLLMLLYWELDLDINKVYEMSDIVALGTIADVVPLINENRLIAKIGLKRMKEGHRPVFKLLNELVTSNDYPEQTVGYKFGPMINAIGRLDGDVTKAIKLFLTEDETEMNEIINFLIAKNEQRKILTSEQLAIAEELLEEQIAKEGCMPNVIVLEYDDFHEGIIGLIAGQLKEKYNRPVIVFAGVKNKPFLLKGSARSIEGFDIKVSFDCNTQYIEGYGGHPKAGGLSILRDNLDIFRKKINEYSKNIITEDLKRKTIKIDYVLTYKEINSELIDDFKFLSPFGEGFSFPNIVLELEWDKQQIFKSKPSPDMTEDELEYFIPEPIHVKLSQKNVGVLFWNKYKELNEINFPNKLSCLGVPQINYFRGSQQMQFICNEFKY